MKGDFSRVSYNPRKHYLRVLMQQGRVMLDSDFNEQVSILLDDAQTIAEDLIGPHGGPEHRCGFEVSLVSDTNNFRIGTGHYYIDGILCRNDTEVFYTAQPGPRLERFQDRRYLVYLEAWEHHVTAEEDESLREEALGGADTTTRSKVAWRVRTIGYDEAESEEEETWLINLLERLCHPQEPKDRSRTAYDLLKERRIDPQKERARMAVPLPNAGYRGSENQLFRVEIHDGGVTGSKPPTFKWARDNASVVFPIVRLGGATAKMEHLGEDGGSPLQEDDWVEIVDRNTTYRKRRVPLLRVKEIDRVDFSVTLDLPDGVKLPVYEEDSDERPLLRRWDSPGTVEIEDPQEDYERYTVARLGEEGLRVRLEAGRYYAGDYWTIPVRAGAGDNVRSDQGQESWSRWMPPQGVSRHYAPLAILSFEDERKVYDCRKRFEPLSASPSEEEEEATTGFDHYEPRTLLGLFVDGVFHAVHDLLTIGRQEDNDITIPLDTVSRHQARVERSRDEVKLTVFDNVTNDNTYRNEEFVPRGRSVKLLPGDKIYLGDKEIEVVEKEVDEER